MIYSLREWDIMMKGINTHIEENSEHRQKTSVRTIGNHYGGRLLVRSCLSAPVFTALRANLWQLRGGNSNAYRYLPNSAHRTNARSDRYCAHSTALAG